MPEKELTLRIGRREFSRSAVIALLGAATPSPSPTPTPGDVAGAVSANHGHTAVVTAAQIAAANAVSLDIRGSATHPHTVELSAAEVGMIGNRQTVAKPSSSDDGHMHTVTFN